MIDDIELVQLLQLNAFCFISDTPRFVWHCTHTGVSDFSHLYTVTKCTYKVVLVPPCGTLFSPRHQHWSVDFLGFFILRWILSLVTYSHSRMLTASFTRTKLNTDEPFWFSLSSELQGKPGDHLSHRGLRSTGTGLFDLVTTTTTNSQLLCPPARPNSILFGWYLGHGTLLCLPTILTCVSRDDDAQKIKPPSTQMNPCPDRPLLLLWWALDFALLPLPARFTWIPLLKVIAIVSIGDTWERHCVLCPYFRWIQHLVIYFRLSGKEKRLILKGTRLDSTWNEGNRPGRSQCLYLTGH